MAARDPLDDTRHHFAYLADEAGRPASPQSHVFELLGIFRQHWILFFSVLTILAGSATAIILRLSPMFTSEAVVLLDQRTRQVIDVGSVLGGLTASAQLLQTQIESELQLVLSQRLMDPIMAKFALDKDPEFNRPPLGLRGHILAWVQSTTGTALGNAIPDPAASNAETVHRIVIHNMTRHLGASVRGRSTALQISFESNDAVKAAAITNAFADGYVLLSVQERAKATRDALLTLTERSHQLRDRVAIAENTVEDYRNSAHLVSARGGSLIDQQVAEQASQLSHAQGELVAAEARLRRTETDTANSDTAPDVLASPLVQHLREEEAKEAAAIARSRSLYGEQHPFVQRLVAAQARIGESIRAEVGKVARSSRVEVDRARARVASVSAQLEDLTQLSGKSLQAQVHLRELEREANVQRSLYEAFLRRIQEVSQQVGLEQPYAEVITPAEPLENPSWPNAKVLIPSSVILSAAMASVCVVCANMLGKTFRSLMQVEQVFGDRVIELVPIAPAHRPNLFGRQIAADLPTGAYAEAIHGLRVQLRCGGDVDRSVLFTSSVEMEGKTTTAISFARQEARAGLKVLVIDADLRRPRIHTICGGSRVGLAELLTGEKSFQDVVQRDPISGFAYLAAGELAVSPIDLFTSPKMEQYLRAFERLFDRIVIDSPAVLAVADARILTTLAQRTIYVVRWAHTPRRLAQLGFELLQQSGGAVLGPISVQVDASAVAHGGATYVRGYLT